MISSKEKMDLNTYLNSDVEIVNTKEFYLPIIIFSILIVIIYNSAFENNTYSCNNVVANVYLYVLFSLVLFHIFTLLFVKNKTIRYLRTLQIKLGPYVFLILFMLVIIGLFYLFFSLHTNIIGSHIMLIVLVALCSYILSYLFILLKMQGLYNQVIFTTVALIFGLMCIFYYKQDLLIPYLQNDKIYITMIIICIIVIILSIIYYYLYGYSKILRIIGASIIVVLFAYILLADTQKILEITPNECKKALTECNKSIYSSNCDLDKYPSYPQKGYEIFNDIIEIARNIAHIFLAANNDDI